MIRKICICSLVITALFSAIMFAGVPNVSNWWEMSVPYLIIYIVSLTGAMILAFSNAIRRVTYPAFTCMCAWVYEHNLIRVKFTQSCYRVYKMNNYSYSGLFDYVQKLFSGLFGIRDIRFFSAEGLDIFGNNPEKILADAVDKIKQQA